jgi:ComF family protein
MLNFLKDIIAPKKCYSCNKEWHFLCPQCMSKMSNFNSICYVCKQKTDNFKTHKNCQKWFYLDQLIILTHYKQEPIKKLIKDAKFYYKKDILDDFAKYLWEKLLINIKNKDDYIFIPVPMYFLRKWKRWYNQSEILVNYLVRFLHINKNFKIIKRIKNTRQQSKLSRQKRLQNLEKAFKINKKELDKIDKNKTIVLIDDVISTWTTLNLIAKLLKDNWFVSVIWLVIASD